MKKIADGAIFREKFRPPKIGHNILLKKMKKLSGRLFRTKSPETSKQSTIWRNFGKSDNYLVNIFQNNKLIIAIFFNNVRKRLTLMGNDHKRYRWENVY